MLRPRSNDHHGRDVQGVPQLNGEGTHMPAFTFEKLSAPASHGPAPAPADKQRGSLAQLVNRLVTPRVKRDKSAGQDSEGRQTKTK